MTHLSLGNYRNYRTAEISFFPGPNLLVGGNGQGKTNIAEAIMYFATLRSHRVSQESALIRAGEDSAVMRMKLSHGEREALLEMQLNRKQPNKAQLNRNVVRPRDLMRVCSAILFAPEDLSIARGEPSLRRRFLDDALIARYPAASGVLSDYERVLKQRNTLLRSAKHSSNHQTAQATLSVWNEQLVSLGSQIIEHRRNLVRDLTVPLQQAYLLIANQDQRPTIELTESVTQITPQTVTDVSRETTISANRQLSNVSRETIAREFHSALEQESARELERGQTLVGPHRDDLELTLNDLPVKGYASHGETWSFVLSLRLALAELLRQDSQLGDPVIILDDVFAELDQGRRNRLMSAVQPFEQIIVTAAVESDVPHHLPWKVTHIHEGRIIDTGVNLNQSSSEEELS